jgi:hypothetical protein
MKEEWKMKIVFAVFVLVLAFAGSNSSGFAQQETATGVQVEKDIALMRRDLRTEKKRIIALNLTLTEGEAIKFWPAYDQYIADITKVYDQFYDTVKQYAMNQKTMSDADASASLKRWGELLVQIAKTRQRHIPIIQKVIPPHKAALFFNVDRRLYSLLELQVVSEMPLLIQ